MNVLTIILTFILAYALFMTATYLLARLFFPMEDTSPKRVRNHQNTRNTSHLRSVRKRVVANASPKIMVTKAMA
ncbi:MAG TPA: hypothetical protein VIN08_01060 [Ohtaekwangia sp.]|uniref:hypothetical protein n=1 Tax=Ohtaekwangia sp. TaxID=2066019 RepID=UPI002F935D39